ncbi:glycosyl transferase [Spirochaetia bacterium]|nr:glycosyl transferase [Spirochaetia bacterium]
MKILYDHSCFRWNYGGVPKYFCEIIRRLPKDDWLLPIEYSNNQYLKDYKLLQCKPFLPDKNIRIKSIMIDLINRPLTIKYLLSKNYDIYHQTHYNNFGVKYVHKKTPIVTTIYDMNFFTIPKYYSNFNNLLIGQKKVIKDSKKLIAISETTKKDLTEYLSIPESKISVIHLGIDKNISIESYENRLIEYPYILFVGQRHSYKNFRNIALAFSIISKKYSDLKLVCTGPACSKSEFKFIKSIQIADKTMFFQATEFEMYSLYHYAEMMVFPSFYEGFGLPLLEAMINKCPVICSDRSCFPEIADNAALYFNPSDLDSIVNCIEKVLMNTDLKKTLQEKGIERCNKFSWDTCAEEHLSFYSSLL